MLVHWRLADDITGLKRAKDALAAGTPLPMALREARAWGQRERLFERALPRLSAEALAELVCAASICDGLVKGLRHDGWPVDAWDALRRLVWMVLQALAPQQPTRSGVPRRVLGS